MKAWLGLLPIVLGLVAVWWWWPECQQRCDSVDQRTQELLHREQELSALALIDGVDARCHCGRFTSGDEPPQSATLRVCIQRLLDGGQRTELMRHLDQARGPMLRELSKSIPR
ncbi:hypothetical protein LXT21_13675 [Myxococcus sp. K38C18041901]|uniref:hypothetical protein n=1 Tax=Myxococcus guangdongensis TaxID=2906760 RepID=UPI0020A73317|nr:hypothetical protein [Myxococcus guangdongensis]MCP3059829.1 hypothetical protein [Myxococcus guangdongensis]